MRTSDPQLQLENNSEDSGFKDTSLAFYTSPGAGIFGQESNLFTDGFCLLTLPCFCGKKLPA